MLRPETLIVFDGQSLNVMPQTSAFPAQVMSVRTEPWCNSAIGGQSWTVLLATAPSRLHLLNRSYEKSVLVLAGGYADIVNEGNSGAVAYSDQQAYASAARAAGFDKVIATTMTHGTGTTAPQRTQINAYNALILADSGSDWDAVVDFANLSELSDPSNPVYFSDGIHWTTAGAAAAAGLLGPALSDVIDSL